MAYAYLYQFQKQEVTVTVKGVEYTSTLRYRDIMTCIREQVADPDLQDVMVFHAERRYIRNPSGDGNERVYEEYHHGDDMWQIQVSVSWYIPPKYKLTGILDCNRG